VDLFCCSVDQYIQRPYNARDRDDMECHRTEDLASLNLCHLQFLPLSHNHNIIIFESVCYQCSIILFTSANTAPNIGYSRHALQSVYLPVCMTKHKTQTSVISSAATERDHWLKSSQLTYNTNNCSDQITPLSNMNNFCMLMLSIVSQSVKMVHN